MANKTPSDENWQTRIGEPLSCLYSFNTLIVVKSHKRQVPSVETDAIYLAVESFLSLRIGEKATQCTWYVCLVNVVDVWSFKFHNRMVLSDAHEASNGEAEWIGEKITVFTSDVWPRNVWASWTDNGAEESVAI